MDCRDGTSRLAKASPPHERPPGSLAEFSGARIAKGHGEYPPMRLTWLPANPNSAAWPVRLTSALLPWRAPGIRANSGKPLLQSRKNLAIQHWMRWFPWFSPIGRSERRSQRGSDNGRAAVWRKIVAEIRACMIGRSEWKGRMQL